MSGPAQIREGERTRQRMLTYIKGYQAQHGWAPTVREIGSAVGLASPSSVQKHLTTLHRQGELVLGGGPRMIRLQGTIDLRPDDEQEPPVGRHPAPRGPAGVSGP